MDGWEGMEWKRWLDGDSMDSVESMLDLKSWNMGSNFNSAFPSYVTLAKLWALVSSSVKLGNWMG